MKADIILPCYNASDVTWRALCQLLLFHNPRDFHIILIDDCSADDTPLLGQWIQRLGGTYIRNDVNVGPHEAWNLAAKAAKTDILIFMNNDILIGPGVLDALIEQAEDTGHACVTEYRPDNEVPPGPSLFMKTGQDVREPLLNGYDIARCASFGTLFAVTRRAWGQGVDSRMRLAYADIDFIYSLPQRGYTPTVLRAYSVFHLGSVSRKRNLSPEAEVDAGRSDYGVFCEKWAAVPEAIERHTSPCTAEEEIAWIRNRNEKWSV